MKIGVFLMHPPTMWNPGGGEAQVVETKRALERRGIEVALLDVWARQPDFDVLHVFGSNHETAGLVATANRRDIPTVVSAISFSGASRGLQWLSTRVARVVPVPTIYALRRMQLHSADAVVAASHAEAKQLEFRFGVAHDRIWIVPHGVDPSKASRADPAAFAKTFGFRNFVLEVGRINRHKGQLRLVQALEDDGVDVVLIGKEDSNDPEGVAQFRAAAKRSYVHLLPAMAHDDPMLFNAYSAARAHVLPSFFESLGIVTLEAAASGTAVVTGGYAPIREYLEDRANYCNPRSLRSIRDAVLGALERGPAPGLRDFVLSRFSWDTAASRLEEVYRHVLRGA